MKKYLIVLAAAIVALASCKPGSSESGSKYTKISFKESSIELAVGETTKLKVLYEPTTLEAPVCEWSSSNAEVATVDQNGNVEAISVGEANITAKNGDLTAACRIIVKSVYGAYFIEDYGVFGTEPQSWVEGSDSIFNLSWAGGEFNCQIGYWPVLAWDGNVTFVSGTGWQGKGFILFSYVPFYTINDTKAGEYNGTPFGWGSFALKDTQGNVYRNIGEAGKLDKAIWSEYIDSYITELLAGGDGSNIKFDLFEQATSGAQIFIADHTKEDAEWDIDYGLISAVVKDMELNWDSETETFSYKADIDWLNNIDEDRFYGLKYDENGPIKPYDLDVISEHYELDYAEMAAPSAEPKRITKRYNEVPVMHFNKDLKATDKLLKK